MNLKTAKTPTIAHNNGDPTSLKEQMKPFAKARNGLSKVAERRQKR
jgi:hypothetical protein